jgi:anaerobic C4-dicarboxylate transporter
MAKDMWGKIAVWAFLIGVVIALVIGLWQAYSLQSNETPILSTDNGVWIGWLLAFLGVIIGVLAILGRGTITKSETPAFLMAGIALLIMYGVFNSMAMYLKPWLGPLLAGISLPLAIFIAPAVGILAIKAIWDIGKNE